MDLSNSHRGTELDSVSKDASLEQPSVLSNGEDANKTGPLVASSSAVDLASPPSNGPKDETAQPKTTLVLPKDETAPSNTALMPLQDKVVEPDVTPVVPKVEAAAPNVTLVVPKDEASAPISPKVAPPKVHVQVPKVPVPKDEETLATPKQSPLAPKSAFSATTKTWSSAVSGTVVPTVPKLPGASVPHSAGTKSPSIARPGDTLASRTTGVKPTPLGTKAPSALGTSPKVQVPTTSSSAPPTSTLDGTKASPGISLASSSTAANNTTPASSKAPESEPAKTATPPAHLPPLQPSSRPSTPPVSYSRPPTPIKQIVPGPVEAIQFGSLPASDLADASDEEIVLEPVAKPRQATVLDLHHKVPTYGLSSTDARFIATPSSIPQFVPTTSASVSSASSALDAFSTLIHATEDLLYEPASVNKDKEQQLPVGDRVVVIPGESPKTFLEPAHERHHAAPPQQSVPEQDLLTVPIPEPSPFNGEFDEVGAGDNALFNIIFQSVSEHLLLREQCDKQAWEIAQKNPNVLESTKTAEGMVSDVQVLRSLGEYHRGRDAHEFEQIKHTFTVACVEYGKTAAEELQRIQADVLQTLLDRFTLFDNGLVSYRHLCQTAVYLKQIDELNDRNLWLQLVTMQYHKAAFAMEQVIIMIRQTITDDDIDKYVPGVMYNIRETFASAGLGEDS